MPTQKPMADLYGERVSTWSEEWRAACEARMILALPTKDARASFIDRIVWTRCKAAMFDTPKERADAAEKLREKIKTDILREWEWRRREAGAADE